MNVDADVLSHILKGEHNQHMEADSVHSLISQLTQGTTLMEAYSCNIWVTDTLNMQKDPKAMPVKDWVITQSKYPAIREIKYLINNKKLKGWKVYSQDPQITKQYLRQCSHLVLCKGVLYRWVTPSKEEQNALQLVIPQNYQKKCKCRFLILFLYMNQCIWCHHDILVELSFDMNQCVFSITVLFLARETSFQQVTPGFIRS